mmetsp:Transcript_29139/g.84232  ORF Transcript_29139/g.84232 Transcript_29139/m.84232 type:complete len:364 (-) Transcript_29139:1658-2749(-)
MITNTTIFEGCKVYLHNEGSNMTHHRRQIFARRIPENGGEITEDMTDATHIVLSEGWAEKKFKPFFTTKLLERYPAIPRPPPSSCSSSPVAFVKWLHEQGLPWLVENRWVSDAFGKACRQSDLMYVPKILTPTWLEAPNTNTEGKGEGESHVDKKVRVGESGAARVKKKIVLPPILQDQKVNVTKQQVRTLAKREKFACQKKPKQDDGSAGAGAAVGGRLNAALIDQFERLEKWYEAERTEQWQFRQRNARQVASRLRSLKFEIKTMEDLDRSPRAQVVAGRKVQEDKGQVCGLHQERPDQPSDQLGERPQVVSGAEADGCRLDRQRHRPPPLQRTRHSLSGGVSEAPGAAQSQSADLRQVPQ